MFGSARRYELNYDPEFDTDLARLDAFAYPTIKSAVTLLSHQAEVVTRNRRPLRAPVSWCLKASWQLRVGAFRVLYDVRDHQVFLLRVVLKASRTTEEMGS